MLFGPVDMINLVLHCFSPVPAIMHSGTIQRIRNVGRLRALGYRVHQESAAFFQLDIQNKAPTIMQHKASVI